uniref:Uncharacterized protein n=1 Tax=Rhizophora mucronata TaxID=61149 RepID=A0A2P2NFL6_RHIMU
MRKRLREYEGCLIKPSCRFLPMTPHGWPWCRLQILTRSLYSHNAWIGS